MAARLSGTLTSKNMIAGSEGKGPRTLREHCEDRAKSLMATRKGIDPIVSEISSLAQPARSRFMPVQGRRNPAKTRAHRLYDGHGIRAARVLTSGSMSGMSSPSRPWFKTKVADDALMKFFAVKQWFSAVDRIMMSFIASTNLYRAFKAGYGELGLFATEAAILDEHWQKGLVAHSLIFGEYWIDQSDTLEPDTLLRYAPMSVRTVVARFVADRFDSQVLHWDRVSPSIKTSWDNSRYDEAIDILHLIEPNPAYDPQRFDAAGKPWRSVYWEPGRDSSKSVLQANGREEQPFWSARWDAQSGDAWGIDSPGWVALPDLRALQAQAKRKGDATDMTVFPPMMGPGTVKLKMAPKAFTAVPAADQVTVKPVYQPDYRSIEVIGRDVIDAREAIDDAFFVDLFMAITEMDGVQPRNNEEIFSRNEEKLAQLGPVVENVNTEKLGVTIDRVFGICMRRGMFPPAPEELQGMEIVVEYVSILAQAQRAIGLTIMERSLGFVGNLSATFTDIADNIDGDAVFMDYWERSGAPMEAVRDPQERDRIRAGRAQQLAAKQAQETMPAVESGAKAAELLSQTDVRGRPVLDTLFGG